MRVTPVRGVHFRAVGDEVVLLDAKADNYYRLNPTGATAWLALVRTGQVSEAVDAVCRDFCVERAQATQDVERLVAALISQEFLTPQP